MPAHAPTLSEDQLDAITAFVEDLARAQLGSEAYTQVCASCHGAAGEGGAGPVLIGTDVPAGVVATVISEGAGTMPGFGASLANDELEAVIFFTRRLVAGLAVPGAPEVDATLLYADLCAVCHGAEGEGGAGPTLLDGGLSDEELATIIADGQGSMPGFGEELSPDDLSALVDHVRSLSGEAPVTATGDELYAQWCAVCHGGQGEGGTGPSLLEGDVAGDELTTVIVEGRGSMPGFGSDLSDDGAQVLAAFVEGLAAAETTTLTTAILLRQSGPDMYAEQCALCHALDGSGDLGPDLRGTELSLNEVISRIYGGHAGGMPGFEGELSGLEVQEVARFVTTLGPVPEGDRSVWIRLWPIFLGVLLVIGLGGYAVMRGPRGAVEKEADTTLS